MPDVTGKVDRIAQVSADGEPLIILIQVTERRMLPRITSSYLAYGPRAYTLRNFLADRKSTFVIRYHHGTEQEPPFLRDENGDIDETFDGVAISANFIQ